MSTTSVTVAATTGETGMALLLDTVNALLAREEEDRAQASELVGLLDKALTLAKQMKSRGGLRSSDRSVEGLTALLAPARARKARLDKSVKYLQIRIKVLEFVLQHPGLVFDAESWYLRVSTYISNADDGALVELRARVAGLPGLQVQLGSTFDETAAANIRDKLRREEKDLRSKVEAAFRFLRDKKVLFFSEESNKITHAERK